MSSEPIHVTDAAFEKAVLQSPVPVIVDFWAPWCGPCRMVAPVLDKIAKEQAGKVVVAKVNTDEEQEIASHFQIRSIPTLMVFREQIIVFSQPGALPQGAFEQVVEKVKDLDMDEVRKQIEAQDKDGDSVAEPFVGHTLDEMYPGESWAAQWRQALAEVFTTGAGATVEFGDVLPGSVAQPTPVTRAQ